MRTKGEIFEEWLIKAEIHGDSIGRRFHPIPSGYSGLFANQIAIFDHRMRKLRQMFAPNKSIDIHTDFIDDGECNAYAAIYNGVGLIGITRGAVLIPVDVFYRMFSHPLVMPGIGTSSLERVNARHREGMPSNYDDLVATRQKAGRNVFPKPPDCPIRNAVAEICIDLMCRFIAMHEIAHIVHGHVEYMSSVRSIHVISEALSLHTSATPNRDDLDYQTIELWADHMAVSAVLGGMLTKSPGKVNGVELDVRQRIYLWGFAFYILFRIWGLGIDPADMRGTHPPTALRFLLAIDFPCRKVVQASSDIREEEFFSIIRDSQREADKAIKYCGGTDLALNHIIGIGDPAVSDHSTQLMKHFDEVLAPKLMQYSYIPLSR